MSLMAKLRPALVGLRDTAARFPIPLLACLVFCAFAVGRNHDWLPDGIDRDLADRVQGVAILSFLWALSCRLIVESRGWRRAIEVPLAAVGIAFIAVKLLADQPELQFQSETVLFLGPALVLLILAAPFLTRLTDAEAFWDFNRSVWLGAAFAGLLALILGSGLAAALAAIEELFNLDISSRPYQDIWSVVLGLFGPWLALARIPRRFDAPEGAACPRALSMLIGIVLMPLAIGYLLIVYAYIARNLVLWELPGGQVAAIVGGYAAFGIAAFLTAWPLRNSGPVHVRLFCRLFPAALIPPMVLLYMAIAIRIDAHGITEPRYALVVIALWLAFVVGLLLFRRPASLAPVPLVLAVLLAGTSFGPWGAADSSLRSQVGRLQCTLTEAGLFSEGRIFGTTIIAGEAKRSVASIVRYLRQSGRLDAIASWFEGGELPEDPGIANVLAAISPNADWNRNNSRQFSYSTATLISLSDDELLLMPQSLSSHGERSEDVVLPTGESVNWYYVASDGMLWLSVDEFEAVSFDLSAFVVRLHEQHGEDWVNFVAGDDMALEERVGPFDVRVVFERMTGMFDGPRPEFWLMDVAILLRMAEQSGTPSSPAD